MKMAATETLVFLQQSGEKIDEILRQTNDLPLRTARLAELLRSLWPSSPLYACLLDVSGHSHLCVLDESGERRSEWAELLHALVSQRDKSLASKTPSAPVPAPEEQGKVNGADMVKLPQGVKLPGYLLAFQGIAFRRRWWGALGMAVPKNTPAETLAAIRLLLAIVGEQLAARLDVEAQEREHQALLKELELQSSLANAGELAGPLAHEFNNFLNIVLLHIALLEAEIPEKLRGDLTELRRQGASMTSIVKQFQQYRRRQQSVQQPADVNRLVLAAARSLAGSPADSDQGLVIRLPPSYKIESTGLRPAAVPLELLLAPNLPPALGSATDLKRLCIFLLTNAAAATAAVGGSVTVRTELGDNLVLLRVEDTGPSVSPELLLKLLEPAGAGRAGTNSLELAACETLVRRLHGKIRCEERVQGGLSVLVELPVAPKESTAAQNPP
jgi:signal transduction histidine kinase